MVWADSAFPMTTLFTPKIRTSARAQPMFPIFITTVEDAIDRVQELAETMLRAAHWEAAKDALWAASDDPTVQNIATARGALAHALASEDWLNDLKVC